METSFLVVTRSSEQKEISAWWENPCKRVLDGKVFGTFEEARSYLRQKITEHLFEAQETLYDELFGSWDFWDTDEEEDDLNELAAPVAQQMIGGGLEEACRYIKQLTQKLIGDPEYVPEENDLRQVEETDDADRYCCYVANDKTVIAYDNDLRLEYNIHRMDREDRYYYLELFRGEHSLFSAQLLNTACTVDDSETVFEDDVCGKQITFGAYPQDRDGRTAEPIVWDVLEEREDRMLVLSHRCLAYRAFHDGKHSTDWEHSEIRQWLNGAFIREAFDETEQARLLVTDVKEKGTGITKDRVFLLSEAEFEKMDISLRRAMLTPYAREQFSRQLRYRYNEPFGFWWLRTPGWMVEKGYDIVHVCANGTLNGMARTDSTHPNGVRAAMWITK